jgi:lysophospholipase L1-like esterase
MLGLSLRDVAHRRPGASDTAPGPAPAPAFLPALTTPGASYLAVVSTERLIENYAGPLVRAAGQDFAGLQVSPAAVQDARGGAEAIRIGTLYDQTGGGRHFTQADPARQFALSDQVQIRGALPIIIDGRRAGSGGSFRAMSSSGSVIGRAFTRAVVIETTDTVMPQLLTSQGEHHVFVMPTNVDANAFESSGGADFGIKVPTSPLVLIHRERGDGQDLFFAGVKVPRANLAGTGPQGLRLGGYVGLEEFTPNHRLLADVAITGALSDGDCLAVDAALRQRFALQAWGQNTRVLLIGDSIAEGVQATLTRGPGHYITPLLGQPTDWWVMATGGKLLAECYADRARFEGQIPAPDTGRSIVAVIQGGINDINTGNDNLYASVTMPYVTWLKAQGKKVVVCTLLPQTAVAGTDARRLAYNAQVRANAAGADAICDLAAEATMGPYPAAPGDPTLYPDAIHPSSLGYSHLAPVYAAAIGGLLSPS